MKSMKNSLLIFLFLFGLCAKPALVMAKQDFSGISLGRLGDCAAHAKKAVFKNPGTSGAFFAGFVAVCGGSYALYKYFFGGKKVIAAVPQKSKYANTKSMAQQEAASQELGKEIDFSLDHDVVVLPEQEAVVVEQKETAQPVERPAVRDCGQRSRPVKQVVNVLNDHKSAFNVSISGEVAEPSQQFSVPSYSAQRIVRR